VLVLDDMISTGGTVLRAIGACEQAGARGVTVLATHGLLLPGSQDMLAHPLLCQLLCCDTVSPAQNLSSVLQGKIRWVDSSPLVAEALARLHEGGSLVELASRDSWPPTS
jgi:ribose-phosphate pyrophosphokinase